MQGIPSIFLGPQKGQARNVGQKLQSWAQGAFQIDAGATPEAAARKREMLAAMLMNAGRPQSVGEGVLDGVTRALSGWQMGRLNKAENEKRQGASDWWADVRNKTSAPTGPLSILGMMPDQPTQEMPVTSAPETAGAFAGAGGLPSSLIQSESGGNWNALNSEGYGGRGQFGADRLADAARAGIIPAGMTGLEYSKQPPAVQQAVETWHRGDVMKDLGQYVGVDPDGPGPIPPLTENSLLAVAHLGGKGGARKFVESGGRYNPSDSNGTSLADYAIMHANGGGAAPVGVPAYSGPPIADLQAAVMNPWLSQEERALAQSMLGQAMQQSDPLRQLQIQQAQIDLQKSQMPAPVEYGWQMAPDGTLIRTDSTGQAAPVGQYAKPEAAPEAPASVREYEYYVQQAQARGEQPMPYERFSVEKARAGASSVTVNNPGADQFAEAFAKGDATTLNTVSDAGMAAQRNLARVDRLESLLSQGPSGMEAGIKSLAGEYGIQTDGIDTLQAAQALINTMVPEQRQPGSGPMSDADLALFKQSLPRLINSGEGNALIVHTLRGIAQYDAQGAQIVQRLRAGEIDRATAFEMLQTRPNPLAGFGEGAARFQAPASAQGLSGQGWSEVNGVRIRRKAE